MLWIGLTGGIASGKSTVSQILQKMDYDVVDADVLAREVIEIGTPGYKKIIQYFGPGILMSDQSIHRGKLGEIVFKNKQDLMFLESVIHPEIQNRLIQIKKELLNQNKSIAFYDVPLLFEKNLKSQFDAVVLVWCDPQTQLNRLMKRNQLSEEEANLRIQSQLPIDEKVKLADYIIRNSGNLSDLELEVQNLTHKLHSLSPRP